MPFVHHCPVCGWSREGLTATLLEPSCGRCGSPLEALTAAEAQALRARERADAAPEHRRADAGSGLAVMIALVWLLPLVGVHVGDLVFAVPLLALSAAFAACRAAARDVRWHAVWRAQAAGLAMVMGSCALIVGGSVLGGDASRAAYYLGAGASATLLGATVLLARRVLAGAQWESLVDAALLGLVLGSLCTWFVLVPGFRDGDPFLTGIVAVDLVAMLVCGLSLVALAGRPGQGTLGLLLLACMSATGGDALVAADATGSLSVAGVWVAGLWSVAGAGLAVAAQRGLPALEDAPPATEPSVRRWLLERLIAPLGAVAAFPVVALALLAAGELGRGGEVFWGGAFALALVLAFGRQAWLLLQRQHAMARERALLHEAHRRNRELEALTALATTMTQTLEEDPIVERALAVLHTAARATSSAMHVEQDGRPVLRATTGAWADDHIWAGTPPAGLQGAELAQRGRRCILRLPLRVRDRSVGAVSLVRPAQDGFDAENVTLLGLLVDQMAMAIQSARDYRERLEEAIRDPLTGVYNRRFLLEALDKEVLRAERYGSSASLVLFDLDEFKDINDTHGHAAGDAVLRRLAEVVLSTVRPSDSFARMGGEEFALLLPETSQLEALLVAERIRTALSRLDVMPDRRVTLSGGVASCPDDAGDSEQLRKRAEEALAWAKDNGKNLCAVSSEVTGQSAATVADGGLAHLYALVAMIDAQHLHTRDHSENVASYAVALGQRLGLDHDRVVRLRRAALLHDVGKVSVSASILDKPAALTDDEYGQIKGHAPVGGTLLAHAGLADESRWVRHHHERVDGRGYPDGLEGGEIPLEARIIFVADSFEAMTSDRPYHAGMPVADALAELRRCAGGQFDPEVVEAMAALLEDGGLTVLALREDGSGHPRMHPPGGC
jgi:diguanylate cyclase (GGDEF)-like protein